MKFSLYADKSRHQLIIPYFDLAPRWKGEEKLGKSRVHHQPNLITTCQGEHPGPYYIPIDSLVGPTVLAVHSPHCQGVSVFSTLKALLFPAYE